MDTKFENKLFHGEIVENLNGIMDLSISSQIYREGDYFSGLLNQYRQKILLLEEQTYQRALELENEILIWNKSYPKMLQNLENLEAKVNDRFFLRSDTEGFYKTIYENFNTLDNVSVGTDPLLNSSNIEVDLPTNLVRLASDGETGRKINRNRFTISLTKGPGSGPERIVTVAGTNISSILDDNTLTGWVGSLVSESRASITLILDIKMNLPTHVGELAIKIVAPGDGTRISAIAIGEDNTGEVVLDGADTSNTNVIPVNKIVKQIQVLIVKNNYDERISANEYRYIFNILSLKVFESFASFKKEGTLISNPYLVYGSKKLAVEVCDYNTANTNIDYLLRFTDTENVVTESQINPVNKPPNGIPYGISIENNSTKIYSNLRNPLSLDPAKSALSLIDIPDSSDLYHFSKDYKVLNHVLNISDDNLSALTVLGNCSLADSLADDCLENKGFEYVSWVYLNKNSGRSLVVGSSGIRIEGLPTVNGVINLNVTGWFKIIIPVSAYFNPGLPPSTFESLKNIDPLFPYNGKYLLEGSSLAPSYYSGFEKRAKVKMKRVFGLEDLSEDCFYLLKTPTNNSPSFNTFYILFNRNTNLKNVYTEYIAPSSDFFYQLQFIAKLKTADSIESPILSSYKIKLGD